MQSIFVYICLWNAPTKQQGNFSIYNAYIVQWSKHVWETMVLINFKLLLKVDHGWLLQGIFAQKSHGSFWQKHFKQSMAIVLAKQQYSMIPFSKL